MILRICRLRGVYHCRRLISVTVLESVASYLHVRQSHFMLYALKSHRLNLTCRQNVALLNTMMTSSNGNIFRVSVHLSGEFTGHRRIPPHKGQWRGTLMLSLICAWTNCWINNRGAGVLRRHRTYYDDTVMQWNAGAKHGREMGI